VASVAGPGDTSPAPGAPFGTSAVLGLENSRKIGLTLQFFVKE